MFNLYRKNVDSIVILLKLEVDEDEDEKSIDNVLCKYFINDFLFSGIICYIYVGYIIIV